MGNGPEIDSTETVRFLRTRHGSMWGKPVRGIFRYQTRCMLLRFSTSPHERIECFLLPRLGCSTSAAEAI